jgi:hypothetical protein
MVTTRSVGATPVVDADAGAGDSITPTPTDNMMKALTTRALLVWTALILTP